MNRLVAHLVALLIAFMPSIALACNATVTLAPGTHTHIHASGAGMDSGDMHHECCHDQNSDQDSSPSSTCSMDAMCAFAHAASLASGVAVLTSVVSSAVPLPPSDRFRSADSAPDLRPPIA